MNTIIFRAWVTVAVVLCITYGSLSANGCTRTAAWTENALLWWCAFGCGYLCGVVL